MSARRAGLLIVKCGLALGLMALVWHLAGGEAAAQQLTGADPLWLAAAAMALTVQTWLSAARWRLTAAQLGISLSWATTLREYYLSQVINQMLPGGVLGDAGRALRARGPAGLMASGQAVIFERAAGQLALLAVLVAGVAATMWTPGGLDWPDWLARPVLWVGIMALVICGVLWGMHGIAPPAMRAQAQAFGRAIAAPGVLRRQLALSLAAVLCNITGFGLCGWAVGVQMSVPALLTLVPLVLLAMVIPLTVAGWGLREGAAVGILPLAGVSPSGALATSLAFGLVFLASTLPGVLVLATSTAPSAMKS